MMKKLATATLAMLFLAMSALAQGPPGGTAAKTGKASFKFGGAEISYGMVTGSFQQSYGFQMVSLNFSQDGKPAGPHLGINLMIQQPGSVNLKQPGNGIGFYRGKIFASSEAKSDCSMTVTKLSPTAVEGTAECRVIAEVSGSQTDSLTAVKFSASTQ